jgi:starch phosphorylase
MARLAPHFSASRAVRQYAAQHYLPAAMAYRARTNEHGAVGQKIADWQRTLEEKWNGLRFGGVKIESGQAEHRFEVQVYLHGLDPEAVRVELYAEGIDGKAPLRQPMQRTGQLEGPADGLLYSARVSAARPASHYTARLVPHFEGVATPLEAGKILWLR